MQLAAWLKANNLSDSEFARRIGGTPGLVHGYLHRTIWPSRKKCERILAVTKGCVTPNDLYGLRQRSRR